jgi:hypothetical protein
MLKIFTQNNAFPEKKYACHILFQVLLEVPFALVSDENESHYRVELPNGKSLWIEDHFFSKWKDLAWLQTAALPRSVQNLHLGQHSLVSIFGRNHYAESVDGATCGLDLIASTFFMLSRWEEYVQPERDRHERFPAAASLAVKFGFLNRPIVNEYARFLGDALGRLGLCLPRPERRFKFSLTHDVDHPKLWWTPQARYRSVLGALIKRGVVKEASFWWNFPKGKDPFDIFDEWLDLAEAAGHVAQFNFFGKRPSSSDCYYPLEHPFVRDLMQKIAQRQHLIGFHTSYEAWNDPAAFSRELKSLQALSPLEINSGRQHYLRFSVSDTWAMWDAAGLVADSSLGYSEQNGFRCGICCAFPVFDLIQRKMLDLLERPLIAMDVSMALYQGQSPEAAMVDLLDLKKKTAEHQGDFVLLWHNSSWNGPFWLSWQNLYKSIIK